MLTLYYTTGNGKTIDCYNGTLYDYAIKMENDTALHLFNQVKAIQSQPICDVIIEFPLPQELPPFTVICVCTHVSVHVL